MAFPPLLIALAFGAALGGGLGNIIIALGVGFVPAFARMTRGQVLSVRGLDFVVASELNGASSARVLMRRILPNSVSPVVILITLDIGVAILAEAGLSYLGIGVRPPTAAWGAMVSEGYRYLLTFPLLSIAPGLCIVIVVLAFNFLGDALRDSLDPKIRGTLR
jgi:ABC-type dipeptide/oligopeptide/nickel transport system permease subunit